jgi:nitrite reductase/ring-hydroxylating ferredoxin subunit
MPLSPDPATADDCRDCPLHDRRAFLRDATLGVAALLTLLGRSRLEAAALPVRFGAALHVRGDERTYPIPAADGATIDKDAQVILVRFEAHVYAFSLSCPHQNTALRWLPDDHRFQCPKHKSKYQPDGQFISGRATRGMDRFSIRRAGETVVVDLAVLHKQDTDAAGWNAALVTL